MPKVLQVFASLGSLSEAFRFPKREDLSEKCKMRKLYRRKHFW